MRENEKFCGFNIILVLNTDYFIVLIVD